MDDDPDAALIHAFASCSNGRELWELADDEQYDELTYSSEGAHPPRLVDVLIDRARTWIEPEAVSAALALASRIAALDPGKVALRDDGEAGFKQATACALEYHRSTLRQLSASEHAAVRAAALHALAGCRNVELVDGMTVADRLEREREAAPLATSALALGAIARRLGPSARDDLVEHCLARWRSTCTHPALLVRVCAVAGRALVDGCLEADDAAEIVAAIVEPQRLPDEWGWRAYDPVATTRDLAIRVLGWAHVEGEARSACIRALASLSAEVGVCDTWEDALFRLAFGDASQVPAAGIALSELDEDQRVAVRAYAEGVGVSTAHLRALGIDMRSNVLAFLHGRGGSWKPFDVKTSRGVRRWHLIRMWREHLNACDPDLDDAVAAIAGGLTPRETIEALASGARNRLIDVDRWNWQRDVSLLVAVMRRLVATELDMITLIEDTMNDARRWSEQTTALALLTAYATTHRVPSAKTRERLVHGLRFVADHPDVQPLLARLDPHDTRA